MVSGFRWSVNESCLKYIDNCCTVVTVILAAFRDKC
jgi:hypothetical protein